MNTNIKGFLARAASTSNPQYPPNSNSAFDPTPWECPQHGFTMGPVLGRGSFGAVIFATKNSDTSAAPLAIKLFPPPQSQSDAQKQDEEALVHRRLTTLGCDAIMPLLSAHFFKSSGQRMLVMPLSDCGTLLDILLRDGPLTEVNARVVIKRIITALATMHEAGVIHRDVSAKNIVLDSKGSARLCDFGLAWDLSRPDIRNRLRPIGTPESCAPEIYSRNGAQRVYSAAGDIFGLGVIAVNVLAGYAPFRSERKCANWPYGERQVFENDISTQFCSLAWGSVWQKVSTDAKELISRCLDKNPNKRPTADQLLNHSWLSPPTTSVSSDSRVKA